MEAIKTCTWRRRLCRQADHRTEIEPSVNPSFSLHTRPIIGEANHGNQLRNVKNSQRSSLLIQEAFSNVTVFVRREIRGCNPFFAFDGTRVRAGRAYYHFLCLVCGWHSHRILRQNLYFHAYRSLSHDLGFFKEAGGSTRSSGTR